MPSSAARSAVSTRIARFQEEVAALEHHRTELMALQAQSTDPPSGARLRAIDRRLARLRDRIGQSGGRQRSV